MNLLAVIHVISALSIVIGIAIMSAVPVSLTMNDAPIVSTELFMSALIPIVFGIACYYLSRKSDKKKYVLGIREGYGIVTFGWITASIFGALPFIMIMDMHWYDAFFETMSGFTTTGASVLDNSLMLANGKKLASGIADLPKGLLYWRSMTHWLGGMGIVVLSLAILPVLGIGGQQLYNAEVPGPTSDQLTPRIADSAKILWAVYILLSVAETLLLYMGGMSLFDAWCHTCGTMATGGFSTQQASVGAYGSAYFDFVITFFMFLAGCNFALHYKALQGKNPFVYFKDEEFLFYLFIVIISTVTVTMAIYGKDFTDTAGQLIHGDLKNAVRFAVFQVVSILTTTGFCTADSNIWPAYPKLLLVLLMFIGGCAGSTGGGIKNSRILLSLKYAGSQMTKLFFPRKISNIHFNKNTVQEGILHKIMTFVFLFVILFASFSLLIAGTENIDMVTAATSSIACLGNIGPGFGKVGATSTYAWFSPFSKIILSAAMLLGRLEIYTVIAVCLPTFWKK